MEHQQDVVPVHRAIQDGFKSALAEDIYRKPVAAFPPAAHKFGIRW
jgi:hypothetical protein